MNLENLFAEHEWRIGLTIKKNYALIKTLSLEYQDVYQELALTLWKALKNYDPQKFNSLEVYIMYMLKYSILNLKQAHKPHGIKGVRDKRLINCISIHNTSDEVPLDLNFEQDYTSLTAQEAFSCLSSEEKEVVNRVIVKGRGHMKKTEIQNLENARLKVSNYLKLSAV